MVIGESSPEQGDELVKRFIRIILGLFRVMSLLGFIAFLELAIVKASTQWKLLHTGERTQGIVVGFTDKKIGLGRNGSEIFVETLVRFQPVGGGQEVRFYDNRLDGRIFSFLGLTLFSEGAKVTVVYDPKYPDQRAVIDYGWRNWIQAAALTFMACMFFIFWWNIRKVQTP